VVGLVMVCSQMSKVLVDPQIQFADKDHRGKMVAFFEMPESLILKSELRPEKNTAPHRNRRQQKND